MGEIVRNKDFSNSQRKILLQQAFKDPKNIEHFGPFFFPEVCVNKSPDFHKELFKTLLSDSNDAIAAPRGHGKLCADSTPVLTENGWKKHGELNIGDYVFHPSGKLTKIIAKNKKAKADFVVYTRDNEKIRCHGEHEWTVWDRNRKKEIIIETRDMIGDLNTWRGRSRFLLPLREALEFSYKELELDPYFVGLWLGDGNKNKPTITYHPNDMDSINSINYITTKTYVHNITGVHTAYYSKQGIIEKIKKLNLFNNKHIPKIYQQASKRQRLELLAGLIDSDGYVDKDRGRVRFVNINKRLIDDVCELVRSLGMRPIVTQQLPHSNGKGINGVHICYTVQFNPIENIPTRLKRKKIKRLPKRPRLGIIKVEYNPNGERGNCIEVDSKDGLYLVGKNLIPTHNSSATGIIFLIYCIVNKLEKYIVYISQNHAKTVQFLSPIRHEFKNNKLLRYVYGDLTPKLARDDDGKDREDCFDVGGCRIEAVSFEKNLRGFKYNNIRPTLIIGDDIEDDQRVLNPELRIKDSNKLNKVIIPSLDIDGRFKMIGTLLHHDSLLKEKLNTYNGKVYTACTEDFKNILWPERFTKEKLEKIKKDIGSIPFQQEYLNNPIDTTSSLIKREWIQKCFREDISFEDISKMDFNMKVLGVDFAFSDRITADSSAFVALGEKDGFFYLVGCRWEKGLSLTEQMMIIKNELNPEHDFMYIGLEENSIKSISKDIDQWNLPIKLYWTAASDPAKTKTAYKDYDYNEKRQTVGKIGLISRIGTAFENGKFIIPYKTDYDKVIADKAMAELTSYALADGKLVESGVHPDMPIGLGYALELIRKQEVIIDF